MDAFIIDTIGNGKRGDLGESPISRLILRRTSGWPSTNMQLP